MGVTLLDIANRVGVSVATVSLAINNKGAVRAETKEKILQTAREMGYTPNAMAQMLANERRKIIGIVVTDLSNVYFGQLINDCVSWIQEHGYQPLIASSQDKYAIEEKVIDHFIALRVAGVIIIPPTRGYSKVRYLKKLESYGIKYIFLSSYYEDSDAPYVMVDLKKGSYQAVKYLLDLGHRDIYFFGTDPSLIPTSNRMEGYYDAYRERSLQSSEDQIVFCEGADFASAYSKMTSLLEENVRIDAVVTINDIMALGCLRALNEGGIRVPEDISLIGYDDIIYSEVASISLTTVHQDIGELARRTVNMLCNMIRADTQSTDKLLLEPYLIVRGSTGLCPAKTRAVAIGT